MSGYTCDACGGQNPVSVLVTNLANGQTDSACDADVPIMLVGQLALWAGVDPGGLYDSAKRFIDKETRKQEAAADAAGKAAASGTAGNLPGEDGTAGDGHAAKPTGGQLTQPSLDDIETAP